MGASIRTRLTLSHLAVVIAAMGLSGGLLLSLLESYFVQAVRDSLIAQAQITAQALVPGALMAASPVGPSSAAFNTIQQQSSNFALRALNVQPLTGYGILDQTDLSYLANASLQLSTNLETRIRVLNADGSTLVDSEGESGDADLTSDPLVAAALTGQVASRTDSESGMAVLIVAYPVLIEGKPAGVVYLSQPLRDMIAVIRDVRSRWLLSTAVALGLSLAVSLLLSQAIMHPLRRLTEAASSVAKGHLDQQVPITSQDELGRLSQAFNEMTRKLQAARQMQLDFVANVSHELRTPLTAVKGLVETLRAGAVDDPEVRDHFLETAEEETDRLIRLVNDLLALSRADSEALNLRRAPLELATIARKTIDRLTSQATAAQIGVSLVAAPDLPLVLADSERTGVALANLLDNAIKYSRPGGRVTVHLRHGSEGMVLVEVQDEGIGISAADLAHVGRRFYRADRARSRAEGGSGLGLAIARAFVEAQGGQLWLESEEGRGTTVTFALPGV
jgi:signal transduction histidine kinase